MGFERRHTLPRLAFGLLLMTFGVLFVLHNLNWIDIGRLLRFWPVIFIILGVSKFLTPYQGWSGFVWIVVGCCLLLHTLHIVSLFHLWPLILVLIGAKMALRALYPERYQATSCRQAVHEGAEAPGELRLDTEAPGAGDGNAVTINSVAFLGGVERRVQACDFKGGSVVAFMGGCDLDLRGANLASPEVTLDVTAFWGGVEISVPNDWRVEWRGTAFLGGFSDRTQVSAAPTGVLILTGTAMMGGVEIHN
jgi:predicted membrane protein